MVTTDAAFLISLWAWSQLDKRRATATPTYGESELRELTRPLPVCAGSPGRGVVLVSCPWSPLRAPRSLPGNPRRYTGEDLGSQPQCETYVVKWKESEAEGHHPYLIPKVSDSQERWK